MSLGVVIKGPEAVVLAADSRVTLQAQREGGPILPVNFDNATKLLSFRSKPHSFVGAVTYGAAVIGQRTAHSFIPELELTLEKQKERLSVQEYSQLLSKFFMGQWQTAMPKDYTGPDMTFIVGGYDSQDAYGKVFLFGIPRQPEPEPRNPDDFGMTWGGQLAIVSRIIHGYDPALLGILRETLKLDEQQINRVVAALRPRLEFPIPYSVLPLQDCVDLSIFLIRSTMIAHGLAIEIRGVGGPVEVAIITRTGGLEYVQRKTLHGERGQMGKEADHDNASDRNY